MINSEQIKKILRENDEIATIMLEYLMEKGEDPLIKYIEKLEDTIEQLQKELKSGTHN